MKKQVAFLAFLIVLAMNCRQNETETFNFKSLHFDTSRINIFEWDTSLYTFPRFCEAIALTDTDISLVDSLLVDAIDKFDHTTSPKLYESFNKYFSIDSFTIDLSKYKRQYFPYKDNNGQKVFQLICFSKPFEKWKDEIFSGGLHGGISKFTLRINLSERKADEFSIGGYG